jgi:hypothetical protein
MSEPTPRPASPTRRLFSRENLLAVLLCLILMVIVILTSDDAPQWIYQGF